MGHLSGSRVRAYLASRCQGNFLGRPQFIAWGRGKKNLLVRMAEALGAMRVRWTVRPDDRAEGLQVECEAAIFEFMDPPARW